MPLPLFPRATGRTTQWKAEDVSRRRDCRPALGQHFSSSSLLKIIRESQVEGEEPACWASGKRWAEHAAGGTTWKGVWARPFVFEKYYQKPKVPGFTRQGLAEQWQLVYEMVYGLYFYLT